MDKILTNKQYLAFIGSKKMKNSIGTDNNDQNEHRNMLRSVKNPRYFFPLMQCFPTGVPQRCVRGAAKFLIIAFY